MKKNIILVIGAFFCLSLSSCRVSFPAQSEEAYQQSVSAIKTELNKEGYNLVKFQAQGGTTDNETYTFSNNNNEFVEFTLAVDRDSDQKTKFIKSVEMRGCTTSNPSDFDHLCSQNGVVATTLKNNQRNDIKGSRADTFATISGIVIAGIIIGVSVLVFSVLSTGN